jgi:hypothetical protein
MRWIARNISNYSNKEMNEGFSRRIVMRTNRILTAVIALSCLLALVLPAFAEDEVVITEAQVNNYSGVVYEALRKYGFEFGERVTVRLANEETIAEISKTPGAGGLAHMDYQDLPSGKKLVLTEILIQSGLSVAVFQRYLAHELCHVWTHQQGNYELDRIFEEGSCEVFSFIAVYEIGSPDAPSIMSAIETRSDAIYGAGFRIVRDFIKRHGMSDWRNRIAGHNMYIWAENSFPVTPSFHADHMPASITSIKSNSTTNKEVENFAASSSRRSSVDVSIPVVVKELGSIAHSQCTNNGRPIFLNMRFLIALLIASGITSFGVWVRYAA